VEGSQDRPGKPIKPPIVPSAATAEGVTGLEEDHERGYGAAQKADDRATMEQFAVTKID
jgi:hypothetical protein